MFTQNTDTISRSCGRCIYWKKSDDTGGECRYNPPYLIPDDKSAGWPPTNPDDYCFRWKGQSVAIREPMLGTAYILMKIEECEGEPIKGQAEMGYRPWAMLSEFMEMVRMEHDISKQAIRSRLNTLVKYGQIGMGRKPPEAANEQDTICLWRLADAKALPDETAENDAQTNPGRPKLHTVDTIISFLRQKHNSSIKRIGIRPLHRAISKTFPMSLSTCANLLREGIDSGLIIKTGTGYWSPAPEADNTDQSFEP